MSTDLLMDMYQWNGKKMYGNAWIVYIFAAMKGVTSAATSMQPKNCSLA